MNANTYVRTEAPMEGQADGRTDGRCVRTYSRTYAQTDGRTDLRTEGQTEARSDPGATPKPPQIEAERSKKRPELCGTPSTSVRLRKGASSVTRVSQAGQDPVIGSAQ